MSTTHSTTRIDEIAPELFRISTYIPAFGMQFGQFLARDEEPLLYHTGARSLFPIVRDAVARLIDPRELRWIGFSHFEADECGSLNEWLALAPRAEAVCSFVGKAVSVDDFASRPSRALGDGEPLVQRAALVGLEVAEPDPAERRRLDDGCDRLPRHPEHASHERVHEERLVVLHEILVELEAIVRMERGDAVDVRGDLGDAAFHERPPSRAVPSQDPAVQPSPPRTIS